MNVYLLGDFGGYETQEQIAAGLPFQNLGITPTDKLVLLGDNLYPHGVSPATEPSHTKEATNLKALVKHCLAFFSPPIYVLPGNHDYNKGKKNGISYWEAQKKVLSDTFKDTVLIADEKLIEVKTDTVVCLLANTQQFLQPGKRRKSSEKLLAMANSLQVSLKTYAGSPTVVCGHHPFYSRAMHGGKFSLHEHLFPFTVGRKRLLVPLPILGSLLAMGRRAIGTREDMRHPRYWRLRQAFIGVFSRFTGLVYAAGHDHNLQHYGLYDNHFIVSGSGSKLAYVRKGGRADFVAKQHGLFRSYKTTQGLCLQAVAFNGDVLAQWPWVNLMVKSLALP